MQAATATTHPETPTTAAKVSADDAPIWRIVDRDPALTGRPPLLCARRASRAEAERRAAELRAAGWPHATVRCAPPRRFACVACGALLSADSTHGRRARHCGKRMRAVL